MPSSCDYQFVIVIPVADRPRQLRACLDSLLELMESYPYGSRTEEGGDRAIRVLLAEDSRDTFNRQIHQQLATDFTARGLTIEYFGQEQQAALLKDLGYQRRRSLRGIVGALDMDQLYHKGASITRNLAYLRLQQLAEQLRKPLFWFIDSDQVFRVNTLDLAGVESEMKLDYFGVLNALFQQTDVDVVTGKVVGDPPVSPVVMAGKFLQDVHIFLQQMAELDPNANCGFHGHLDRYAADAAYHDMADLFGFSGPAEQFSYRCPLTGPHTHVDCLNRFAHRLNHFFDGEHPTRRSYYQPCLPQNGLVPARTVYTGNYLLRAEALRFFIPFAPLKLRMAGPVLGRLIRAELGARFVSVNLPLLHRRTLEDLGRSEFRPGVEHGSAEVDLGGEFRRQFYGDIMLFSIEHLVRRGFPERVLDRRAIASCVSKVAKDMRSRYLGLQISNRQRLQGLKEQWFAETSWWRSRQDLLAARNQFARFFANCQVNFVAGGGGYPMNDAGHEQMLGSLCKVLRACAEDRSAWQQVLAGLDPSQGAHSSGDFSNRSWT